MPILIGQKRIGNITTRVGKNGVILREQSHHYTVQADSKFQDRAEIILCPGLPRYGTVYTDGLAVKSINADVDPDDAWRWHVTVLGSTEVEEDSQSKNQNSGNNSSDPTTWIPIASVKFEPHSEVLRTDFSDPVKDWKNSANKVFETGLEYQRRIAAVPFSQFEPISTKLETIMDRCDTMNSATYKGKVEYSLLLNVENATVGTYSGTRCWRVDYSMRYKKDTWILKKPDVGWGFYDGSGNYRGFYEKQWETGTYDSTKEADTPFLGNLNLDGTAIANQKTGGIKYLEFKPFPQIDFNSFLKVLFT